MEEDKFERILTQSFTRMHKYTCAEATLQGLLEYWDIPVETRSWATGGYMGAIESGNTTCGLLIGASVAIGFKLGLGQEARPELSEKNRRKAITEVKKLYKVFLAEFGCTTCKEFCGHDFSNSESAAYYLETKAWKASCDKGLAFIFNYMKTRTESGKI